MGLVNFTDLDFDQIKNSIRDYLRSNSNFTDYDFEGSNLSNLIDILAYNTYISSYNANMMSNEVFIDSATLRENVVSLARNIGYIPRSRKCAKATISFFVNFTDLATSPFTATLKKGLIATSTGTFNGRGYTFCTLEDKISIINNGIAYFDDVVIYEGSYITETFTVDSNNLNQRFILSNLNIDSSTISVTVKDSPVSSKITKYKLSDNILNIDSNSKVFFLQEIEDQRYELIFGDGFFGKKLENNNYIEVSYVVTNGEDGNNINSFSFNGVIYDNNERIVTSGISLITTVSPSDGGNEIESVASIKKYAPRMYASNNRAVTSTDYETIITTKLYPETESITVFGGEDMDPPQYGKVFIAIKPYYGNYISNSIKDNLKRELKNYGVAGIVPEILDLKYLFVEFDTNIYFDSNMAPSSEFVKNLVSSNIKKYSNSTELNRYGARFKYSKFQKIVDDSHESITSNITNIRMRRDLVVKIDSLAIYEICFGNKFYVRDSNGYNIRSSGFTIKGISDTLYLGDLPNSDLKTGIIFVFKLDSNLKPIIVKNIGKIDYDKGEIIINASIITSTIKKTQNQPIIEISAVPQSNDVIGLQDLYLRLDINNSNINALNDTISSGYDVSGTLYPSSSSYEERKLVR